MWIFDCDGPTVAFGKGGACLVAAAAVAEAVPSRRRPPLSASRCPLLPTKFPRGDGKAETTGPDMEENVEVVAEYGAVARGSPVCSSAIRSTASTSSPSISAPAECGTWPSSRSSSSPAGTFTAPMPTGIGHWPSFSMAT